jgi:hypothetical protein
MKKEDIQESRIRAVLGDDEEDVSEEAVERFCEHLKKYLKFPFEVTGIDDFDWEEFYVVGPGDKVEYERLKKTQPSYKDRYDLLEIDNEADSEWMLFAGEDIAALVRRKSDGRQFYLGLAELKATDRKSNNYQLLDDYAVWFANNR